MAIAKDSETSFYESQWEESKEGFPDDYADDYDA